MPNRKEKCVDKTFKVTVKLPEHVSESIRREKINRLYDILKPKKNDDYDTESDDKFSENPT